MSSYEQPFCQATARPGAVGGQIGAGGVEREAATKRSGRKIADEAEEIEEDTPWTVQEQAELQKLMTNRETAGKVQWKDHGKLLTRPEAFFFSTLNPKEVPGSLIRLEEEDLPPGQEVVQVAGVTMAKAGGPFYRVVSDEEEDQAKAHRPGGRWR